MYILFSRRRQSVHNYVVRALHTRGSLPTPVFRGRTPPNNDDDDDDVYDGAWTVCGETRAGARSVNIPVVVRRFAVVTIV